MNIDMFCGYTKLIWQECFGTQFVIIPDVWQCSVGLNCLSLLTLSQKFCIWHNNIPYQVCRAMLIAEIADTECE